MELSVNIHLGVEDHRRLEGAHRAMLLVQKIEALVRDDDVFYGDTFNVVFAGEMNPAAQETEG